MIVEPLHGMKGTLERGTVSASGSDTPIGQSVPTKVCKGSAVQVEPVRTMGLEVVGIEECKSAPGSREDEGSGVINVDVMGLAAP